MATIEQLKEKIIELTVEVARATVPQGHCPYAYYTCIPKEENCDNCSECKFFDKYESKIRQEVEKW